MPRWIWVFLAVFAMMAEGQQRASVAPFVTQQADAGRAAYQANCVSCHLPDLAGQFEAPPLTGANFMRA